MHEYLSEQAESEGVYRGGGLLREVGAPVQQHEERHHQLQQGERSVGEAEIVL